MTSRNEAKLNMYRAVKQICDDNATIVAANAAFLASFNAFKANLSSLISAVTAEGQIITGISADKFVLKRNLCQTTADIAAVVFAYATATANNSLKDAVNFSYSNLLKIKDDLLAPACQNIYLVANTNATALVPYGITAGMLSGLQAAISDYSAIVPKPRVAKSVRSSTRKTIDQLVKDIDTLLADQLDKLLVTLKATKPEFYHAFKAARVIIDPSTTTTQLKGIIVDQDSKLPVAGVHVEVNGEVITRVKSNKAGRFVAKPLVHGTYLVTLTADGYEPCTIPNVAIVMGHINKLDIELHAAS